ncbi:MAG: tRNA pseudouridine(54/55) synthase Pus10 [Promethearchaeota archaeon]
MTISKLLKKAEQVLARCPVCDWCLGRQFASLGYGLSNRMRGNAFKILLLLASTETYLKSRKRGNIRLKQLAEHGMFLPALQFLEKEGITGCAPAKHCSICLGIMERLDEIANLTIQKLKGWEATSILLGSKISADFVEREEQMRSELQIETGEPLKAELNREIGKIVTDLLNIPVDFKSPDIVVVVKIPSLTVELQVNSLFIYGRYRKLIRGIPQTKWPCRECLGKGCTRCEGTGKMYPESVEELIAAPLLEVTQGKGVKFHGAGREDIDACMLGVGRPFVLEILTPRRRNIDLEEITETINRYAQGKVEVNKLRFTNKEMVKFLKGSSATTEKTYKAIAQTEKPLLPEELQKLETIPMPLEIRQRTPQRVLHRRADRVRRKQIYELKVTSKDKDKIILLIRCQGGLYIKEFISGDDNRTTPSITEILGKPTKCIQLDVIDVNLPEEELQL